MSTTSQTLLVSDTPRPNVRVARFIQPDVRRQLDDSGSIDQCSLFRELCASVLKELPAGCAVVLNLGLIDWFPTAFFRFLLRVNEEVRAADARLMLCCLPPLAKEAFSLMGGDRTFAGQVCESEARAVYAATHPAS